MSYDAGGYDSYQPSYAPRRPSYSSYYQDPEGGYSFSSYGGRYKRSYGGGGSTSYIMEEEEEEDDEPSYESPEDGVGYDSEEEEEEETSSSDGYGNYSAHDEDEEEEPGYEDKVRQYFNYIFIPVLNFPSIASDFLR